MSRHIEIEFWMRSPFDFLRESKSPGESLPHPTSDVNRGKQPSGLPSVTDVANPDDIRPSMESNTEMIKAPSVEIFQKIQHSPPCTSAPFPNSGHSRTDAPFQLRFTSRHATQGVGCGEEEVHPCWNSPPSKDLLQ
jgi:hypothetical protein